MSEESIQCYSCGTRTTLGELVKNQDDCPECGAAHTLADVAKAMRLKQLASTGGEAVAFMYSDISDTEDYLRLEPFVLIGGSADRHFARAVPGVRAVAPLYTQPQPARSGLVVPRELLERVVDILDFHTAYASSAESTAATELRALLNQAGGE
ncbi:hypothetical protein KLEP174_gp55 [Pseudomonas phage vB_PcuM_ KLEP17-4]|nr:hypothetical protein KLEP174_gp55 [Pseudomonas phage vB_PcuM_ KLEP17-4]